MTGGQQPGWRDALTFFSSRLFKDVQMASLFPDSKTFADAIGKAPLPQLCRRYESEVTRPGFDLRAFVDEHFTLPAPVAMPVTETHEDVSAYIKAMWKVLQRTPDTPCYDSLIPLANHYLVPGGRFREIYYWDSYFTAAGLINDGHTDIAVSMLENFLDIQTQVGCIPNGNRAYYHTRSQPPVLALLFDLVADKLSPAQRRRAIEGMESEYAFWMRGAQGLSTGCDSAERVVRLPDGSLLNRYYDTDGSPRPESYREDVSETRELTETEASVFLRHIRAACESGWDFSSRWLGEDSALSSIQTTHILPVDLNCLLYYLEKSLSTLVSGEQEQRRYAALAHQRKQAINRYMYSQQNGFYFDYNAVTAAQTPVWSLAAAVPLFVGLAEPDQARAIATHLDLRFLKEGGLQTTLQRTQQQWDSPNGWAPLQWFAVHGLNRYGNHALAESIMRRWVALIDRYYAEHGVVLEKYDVCDTLSRAGGGEYEVQLGFGWTNGVYQVFRTMLNSGGEKSAPR